MTLSLLLRREPFGGILAEKYGENVKFLNHTGYEITLCIAKGLENSRILDHIKSHYTVSDVGIVDNDIQKFRDMLSDEEEWCKDPLFAKDSGMAIESTAMPTLSSPLDLHWEVTSRCNLYCKHCYNRSSLKSEFEPDLVQIKSIIDELKSIRLRNVVISGGEPLMRRDLKTIIEWVRPLTAILTLSTNGTLIDDDNSTWFPGLIDGANLSLDAGNREDYERFRGRKGSFNRCLDGFRRLVEKKIPVAIQTTISRFNIDRLDELAELIIKEGATSWVVRLPVASGRAIENEGDFLSRNELIQKECILNEIRERYESEFSALKIGMNFTWSYNEPYIYTEREDGFISCAAATVSAALLADGTIAPCALFSGTDFKSDPVWTEGFLNQWKNAECMNEMRRIKLSRISRCYHCADNGRACSTGCRAKSYLNGNLYSPDPDCGYIGQAASQGR